MIFRDRNLAIFTGPILTLPEPSPSYNENRWKDNDDGNQYKQIPHPSQDTKREDKHQGQYQV